MDEKRIDVVAIGALAVDYFALLPTIPGAEQKIIANGYEIHPGGVAGNVITQVARLGISSAWLGKIGDDDTGKILLNEFQKDGVVTAPIDIVEGEHSMFTWIQVDKTGDRSITMFPNVLNKFTSDDIEKNHREIIENAKILQVEACLLPLAPVLTAMEIAKKAGVKIVFDLDVSPNHFINEAGLSTENELQRALELADVLIPCKDAAKELINSDNIEKDALKLLDYGAELCAVTLGADGCIVFTKDEFYKLKGATVDVVDTTGAGDAFHGGFIYGLLNNLPVNNIAEIANACGAICCQRVGARAMGNLHEVVKMINNSKN